MYIFFHASLRNRTLSYKFFFHQSCCLTLVSSMYPEFLLITPNLCKNVNFQMTNGEIFLIFAQNKDSGYLLDLPH